MINGKKRCVCNMGWAFWTVVSLCIFAGTNTGTAQTPQRPPNVILVMTDDQGYGDLSCHGNPYLKTPVLDRLYGQSVRLTNYHVDPTCSPTRSALMTGRYSSRTGVWHTIMGRSILARDEVTMGDVFAASGYRTAMFGKWHLGDNWPYRPQDRGFHEVLNHGGGGVGQTPDYWGNDYFDDTYFHNGRPQKFSGYCTDIWFDAALKFIETNRNQPFFCYLPTNAAHGPYNVAEHYSRPFREQGLPASMANFYGMIVNIDENMGRLLRKLDELGLAKQTIVIFTTDNGTAAGYAVQRGREYGFNAGMRGKKGSEYEGGHRVPCFIRWPGRIEGGRDVNALCAHIDLLPTLIELCGLKPPRGVRFDGTSLASVLTDPKAELPERTLFVHSQRIENPVPWRKCAVMTKRWRLINGQELYDIAADPGQKHDVAAEHPDVVRSLRRAYQRWYEDISERFDDMVRIPLGADEANPQHLTCHDWHTNDRPVPWNQSHIRRDLKANGFWAVEIAQDGRYEITLRTRPPQVSHPLQARRARIRIGDVDVNRPVEEEATSVTFEVDLKAGPTKLETWLEAADGSSRGAYFVEVRRR